MKPAFSILFVATLVIAACDTLAVTSDGITSEFEPDLLRPTPHNREQNHDMGCFE
jgi:hypothetical protein